MRRTPLDVLHDLAEAKYGRGAAVSVDKKLGGYVAIAWHANGVQCTSSLVMATKNLAIRDLRKALQ